MNFIKNLFFGKPVYSDALDLLIKLAVWAFIVALVLLLVNLVVNMIFKNRLKYKNDDKLIHSDYFLKLMFLISLAFFIFIFSVYFAFYVSAVGSESFDWSNWKFYFGLLPQILVYLVVIILFIVRYIGFKKLLKTK